MYYVADCFLSWKLVFESLVDSVLLIEMFEEVASEVVAMLVVIFLVSIAFVMGYVWFLRGEKEVSTRTGVRSSFDSKGKTFNSKDRYTIFHGLYEVMREKEED